MASNPFKLPGFAKPRNPNVNKDLQLKNSNKLAVDKSLSPSSLLENDDEKQTRFKKLKNLLQIK